MDSALTSVGLPIAPAVVMFGLGLSLAVADFARIAREPRAVAVAPATELLLLPAVRFGLVEALGLSPVLAVATLPLVVNFALDHFAPSSSDGGAVGLEFGKVAQVFTIVLVPVTLGMAARRWSAAFADRADRPVRIFSAVVLVAVIVGTLVAERDDVGAYLADIGLVAAMSCACSLAAGHLLPRLARVGRSQAIASAFEVGVHNSTLAITVTVPGSEQLAAPAAVYGW